MKSNVLKLITKLTRELFENFRAFRNKDLYMVNELNSQIGLIPSSDSPFYGIFVGDQLGARMALLKKGDVEEIYFQILKIIYYYGS